MCVCEFVFYEFTHTIVYVNSCIYEFTFCMKSCTKTKKKKVNQARDPNPPSTYQTLHTNTTGPLGGGDKRRGLDEDKSGSDRKKGRGNDTNHAVVKNLFPHGEICMLVNETWAGDFTGKCNDARPKWNKKCKCCPRWFLQKYCFVDCPNAESHVEAEKVPPTILQKMLL